MKIKSILLTSLCLLIFISCGSEKSKPATKETLEKDTALLDELKKIATDRTDLTNWHLNKERAIKYDKEIMQLGNTPQKLTLLRKSAYEWLNAGDYNKSIERMEEILSVIDTEKIAVAPEEMVKVKSFLAISYMRKGEIENCISNHNEYSCLLPIEGDGVHNKKEGSTEASKLFLEILKNNPSDQQTKWLYNIAAMTLDNYPGNIPARKLIPPSVFDSDVKINRFTDYAMDLGMAENKIAGGVIMDDFNNDYLLDIIISSYGLADQLKFFINNGDGTFSDYTERAGLVGYYSGLNMVQADYNNDGHLDFLVLRGAWLKNQGLHPNSLFHNNGDGTFTDVTRKSGLYTQFPTQTASWADYNNDGWIDLFIGNENSQVVNAPCQLFENQKDGTFKNVAKEKRVNISAFIKGSCFGDIDNDGDQDLYVSNIYGNNFLMQNQGAEGDFKFKNIANLTQTMAPENSFPCWMFDYDQNGWLDIFVSGFDFTQFATASAEVAKFYTGQPTQAELPRLYKNLENGKFREVSKTAKVAEPLFTMGCNFGDINNDGYPDFYAGTGTPDFNALIPNKMFLNQSGELFADVTKSGGLGHLQKGHGVAIGDIDNDGDQDIYNVLGGSYDGDNFMNALFINNNNENNWIKLKLEGSSSNRAAIGARIAVATKDKTFYHWVGSGASFGANPLLAEIGIGATNTIKSVEISWPSGKVQQVSIPKVNTLYHILEDEEPKEKELARISFTKSDHGHHHNH